MHQAFVDWVLDHAQLVADELSAYRELHSRSLAMSECRTRFLSREAYQDEIFQFSHAVARLKNIRRVAGPMAAPSAFPAQLYAQVFSDLILVIEALLRRVYPSPRGKETFFDFAFDLATRASLGLGTAELQQLAALRNVHGTSAAIEMVRKFVPSVRRRQLDSAHP